MLLGNITIPLLGMVDTAVIGHLDSAHYIAAVAVGSVIFNFLFWGFGFLRMGTTGLTAQAVGRDNEYESTQTLLSSTVLALVIAGVILLFQHPIAVMAFTLIDASTTVTAAAQSYFSIRIWTTPAILFNYVVMGWLIGKGLTRQVLTLVIVVNVSNILLDLLFVVVYDMTVEGVALASVLAEYIGLLLSLWFIAQQGVTIKQRYFELETLPTWSTLQLHGNIFIRTLCLLFCFAFFTHQGAQQGDTVLAANAVLLHLLTLMAFFLDSLANAAEVMTGQAIGAKNKLALRRSIVLTGQWSALIAILISVFYHFFGLHIITLLTQIPSVIHIADQHLTWLIVAPVIAVWSYWLDGIFIGATNSKAMRDTMLAATFLCYLPAWFLLQDKGNDGLWLALLLFLAARGVGLAYFLPALIRQENNHR